MYILIIVIIVKASVATTTQEFSSYESCLVASSSIKELPSYAGVRTEVRTFCVKK